MKIENTYAARYMTDPALRQLYFDTHVDQHIKDNPRFKKARGVKLLTDQISNLEYFRESRAIILQTAHADIMLLSTKAIPLIKKLSLDKIKDHQWTLIDKIEDGHYVIILNKDEFLKIWKYDNRVVVAIFTRKNGEEQYAMINFTIDTQEVYVKDDFLMLGCYEHFLKSMMFIKFTKPETVLIQGGARKKHNGVKVSNKSRLDVTMVDANWNKITIRTTGFMVGEDTGGFWAIRRAGHKKQDIKVVWINPYQKNGYVRKGKGTK